MESLFPRDLNCCSDSFLPSLMWWCQNFSSLTSAVLFLLTRQTEALTCDQPRTAQAVGPDNDCRSLQTEIMYCIVFYFILLCSRSRVPYPGLGICDDCCWRFFAASAAVRLLPMKCKWLGLESWESALRNLLSCNSYDSFIYKAIARMKIWNKLGITIQLIYRIFQ